MKQTKEILIEIAANVFILVSMTVCGFESCSLQHIQNVGIYKHFQTLIGRPSLPGFIFKNLLV